MPRRRRWRASSTSLTKTRTSTPRPAAVQDLTYTVVNSQNKKEKIALLQNVGGFLRPGEMAALMGCAAAAAARLAAARAALHPAAMQQYPSRGRARICSGRY